MEEPESGRPAGGVQPELITQAIQDDRNRHAVVIEEPDSKIPHWFEVTLGLLGGRLRWKRGPRIKYTDSQLYPIRPSAWRPATYRRIDAVLTQDTMKLRPLKVQAVQSLKDEPNSTWQKQSIHEATTVYMKTSRMSERGKAYFEQMHAGKDWVTPAAWAWFFVVWLASLIAIYLWMVSFHISERTRRD
jgi:hypothetical protein